MAGLHIRGKHYVSRAETIRRYTDGRYEPAGLDEHPRSLDEDRLPREVPLAPADLPPAGDAALLLFSQNRRIFRVTNAQCLRPVSQGEIFSPCETIRSGRRIMFGGLRKTLTKVK